MTRHTHTIHTRVAHALDRLIPVAELTSCAVGYALVVVLLTAVCIAHAVHHFIEEVAP